VTSSTESRSATNAANPSHDADNTGRNVRDRSDATLTPGDQGGTESDREITRQIRRTITSNDQLSSNAKNVKIITANGKVTLRGPVKSDQEKQTIATAAQGVAGVSSVDNQIEVEQQTQQNQQTEPK
jgi:osmotically-inducible protein OsmY